ncbi:MAG: hypothetical protein U0Y68_24220 [Blastocatellia bacterium]
MPSLLRDARHNAQLSSVTSGQIGPGVSVSNSDRLAALLTVIPQQARQHLICDGHNEVFAQQ